MAATLLAAKLSRVATPHKAQVESLLVSEQSLQKFMARRSSLFVNLYTCVCVCVCVYCGSLCNDTPYLAVIPHRPSVIPSRLPSSTPAVPGTDGHASGTAIRMHAGTHTFFFDILRSTLNTLCILSPFCILHSTRSINNNKQQIGLKVRWFVGLGIPLRK